MPPAEACWPTYQHEQASLPAKGTGAVPRLQLPDVLDWQYTGNRFDPTQKPVDP